MTTGVQDKTSPKNQCMCDQSKITKQTAWKMKDGYIHSVCNKLVPPETLKQLGLA